VETIELSTKRTIEQVVAGEEGGSQEVFLKSCDPAVRNSECVKFAIELRQDAHLQVDLQVKVNVGRRPKRVDLVVVHQGVIVLCNFAQGKSSLREANRLAGVLEVTRQVVQNLSRDLRVLGFVFLINGGGAPTANQRERYHDLDVHFGSSEGFLELILK